MTDMAQADQTLRSTPKGVDEGVFERHRERMRKLAMNKHTPGPWERGLCQVTKDFLKGRLTEAVVNESGSVIAITGEGDADARLIAAAPDLLEALQKISSYECEGCHILTSHIAGIARAAIAKATGGTA